VKGAFESVPEGKLENALLIGTSKESRGNSSANTPKFQSLDGSSEPTPQCQTPQEPKDNNALMHTFQGWHSDSQGRGVEAEGSKNIYTQVDDFPKLVEQMNGELAARLLHQVVNFN